MKKFMNLSGTFVQEMIDGYSGRFSNYLICPLQYAPIAVFSSPIRSP